MKNALIALDHSVPKGSALDKSEHELAEALIEGFEAFYRQGVVLDRIDQKEEYRLANYKSFREYMDKRMPCGIGGRHADKIRAAARLRPLLPSLNGVVDNSGPEGPTWTERTVRPLTHKDFTKSDVRRLGKKIATRVRHGEKLTEKLVKSLCDEDRGVERKRRKKKDQELAETPTFAQELRNMAEKVELWHFSLEKVSEDLWEEAVSEDNGCVKDFIRVLSDLASFLRS